MKVNLLGRVSILNAGAEVRWPTAKTRLLAAYLFWNQGRWVDRGKLRGLFWGDADDAHAAASLRTALHLVRRAFDRRVLEVRGDFVRVPPQLECAIDAWAFEEKITAGLRKKTPDVNLLMEAVGLYRGDFLADVDADWCLAERNRLAELHASALRAIVERLAASGLHRAALPYALRWAAADPLDETAHRELMRLYGAMGQPARAAEQYEECRRVLREELGVAPSEATVQAGRESGLAADESAATATRASTAARATTGGRATTAARAATARLPGPESTSAPAADPRERTRFSEHPLRNARFLLLHGEARLRAGDPVSAHLVLDRALELYAHHGQRASQARARLVLGEALLSIPEGDWPERALAYVRPALTYYRAKGGPAEVARTTLVTADANYLMGRFGTARELAEEGLRAADQAADPELQARLSLILALSLRDSYRLKDAVRAFNAVVRSIPHLTNVRDVLRATMNRGIMATVSGDLPGAERFLREAVTVGEVMAWPSPKARQYGANALSLLIAVLEYRGKAVEARALRAKLSGDARAVEPFEHIATLSPASGSIEGRADLEGWLRAKLRQMSPSARPPVIRLAVERLLAEGAHARAARWSSVGIRLARAEEWPGCAALFYAFRALALARGGRLRGALACRRRAAKLADPGDRWTPAWLARVDGAIALAQSDPAGASRELTRCAELFLKIGDVHDARAVQAETTWSK